MALKWKDYVTSVEYTLGALIVKPLFLKASSLIGGVSAGTTYQLNQKKELAELL